MTTYASNQIAQDNNSSTRNYPIDVHGKLRVAYFKYTATADLANGDQIDLARLPFGRVRVLKALSRYSCSALGAARTLSIGLRQYYSTSTPSTDTGTAEDKTVFVNAKDVSGAVNDVAFDGGAGKAKADSYSRDQKTVFAQIDGGTFPNGSVLEGYVVYVVE